MRFRKWFMFGMVCTLCACEEDSSSKNTKKKVFINQFVQHPALDQTLKGIEDGLRESGYVSGKNLDLQVEVSQARPDLSTQIAAKFAHNGPDVVVGIATVAAQSFGPYARKGKVKLVFASITDPLKAGLIESYKKPGRNTSGTSNFVDLEPQLKLFQTIQPSLKKIGFLYNPGEANSLVIIEKLEKLCPKLGITLITQAAHKTSEMSQAASTLSSQVDAIFISNDSTALSALQTIVKQAKAFKIPVYVSDTDAVELGALAALGPNQYNLGKQTASMIVACLKGKNPGDLPVLFPDKVEIYLNETIAQELGMTFPKTLKAQAKKIVGGAP